MGHNFDLPYSTPFQATKHCTPSSISSIKHILTHQYFTSNRQFFSQFENLHFTRQDLIYLTDNCNNLIMRWGGEHMKEIKQTVNLLANGPASYIVREMKTSIHEIDVICEMFPDKISWIEPEAAESKTEISSIIRSTQAHVIPLEHAERDIRSKESKPGLKRYFDLQKKMDDPATSDYQLPSLQREANGLKAAFSRELVELIKKSHEALGLRLTIVESWKDVVTEEIGFMEVVQEEILRRVMSDAHREGLTEIVNQIQERLGHLSRQSVIETNRVKPAMLQFGNIKKLQSTLCSQLQEVVKLEQIIQDKYDVLQELSTIENRITNDLPEETALNALYKNIPSSKASGIRPQPVVSRMAYGRLQPRTA